MKTIVVTPSTDSKVTIFNNGWNSYSYGYRGEGNAHLALSLPDIKKILLIKKRDSKEKHADTKKWDESINFHNNIMGVLLDPFVSKVLKVQIDHKNVRQLENKIATLRPSFRMSKVLSTDCIALMHDYTQLPLHLDVLDDQPTVSFEIKPKCAMDIDGRCKFCWKQAKKLESGRIGVVTNYCPKKLYSGDFNLTKEAVMNLLENPQNNLQIYKNSKLIYSEKHNIEDLSYGLCCWAEEDILATIENVLSHILNFKQPNVKQCKMKQCFPSFTILECIKQLQELSNSNEVPLTREKGYVKLLLAATKNDTSEIEDKCARCSIASNSSSVLCRYYLSKIARDCSIMVSVRQISHKSVANGNIISYNGKNYLFECRIFDLFPKDERKS